MADNGFLVCADITGYTQYLSKSELEHASGIFRDLLGLLLGETRAPLHLSRVEGDAVISYSQTIRGTDPQVLVDRLESTYVAFRRALEQMVLNNTCRCNACANISALDLKFIVHHGQFVVQHLGSQDELVGPEVNFMFRMVKNHIRERLGVPGYLAFTDAAIAALGLPGYAERLVAHTEDDPERGSVTVHVRDMGPVWEARRREQIVDIGETMVDMTREFAAPIEVVWTAITRPELRKVLMGADKMEPQLGEDGRIGRETVYVCLHGDMRINHTILDWDPPFRYVFRSALPMGMSILIEFRLEAIGDTTTRFHYRSSPPDGPTMKKTLLRPFVKREVVKGTKEGFENLVKVLEGELGKVG